MKEIEVKFKIKDIDAIKRKIKKIGIQYKGRFSLIDTWFDTPNKQLRKKKRGLRLRLQGRKKILTFKRDEILNHLVREAEEIEVDINDSNRIRRIIEGLGFQEDLIIKKEREVWLIGKLEIVLDRVEGLGTFLELEGSKKDIEEVVKKLGLEKTHRITVHYSQLFADKIKKGIS